MTLWHHDQDLVYLFYYDSDHELSDRRSFKNRYENEEQRSLEKAGASLPGRTHAARGLRVVGQ